ncbi:MAG: hypothetical protein ABI832_15965 [bacterium]
MKKLLDADDPFFAQVWRRWVVTLIPLVWGCVELYTGAPMWALLFGLAGGYAGYVLLVKGPQDK